MFPFLVETHPVIGPMHLYGIKMIIGFGSPLLHINNIQVLAVEIAKGTDQGFHLLEMFPLAIVNLDGCIAPEIGTASRERLLT